jgi:hypothetical protein
MTILAHSKRKLYSAKPYSYFQLLNIEESELLITNKKVIEASFYRKNIPSEWLDGKTRAKMVWEWILLAGSCGLEFNVG